ncbi:NAD(P)H-binding protein [Amycolatopsis sp. NBC_00345]|uniref:NAD(P)H-binding protein n=1 Tax=Amycolatopsis sp. NBC_00345 TaxID=2975955 RepID=UPI002E26B0A2
MFLVLGATGHVGGEVARQLHQRGEAVRALVRDPAKAKAKLPDGVDVVQGDLERPDTLKAAMADVTAVFLVNRMREIGAGVKVLADAGRLVFLSSASVIDDVAEQANFIGQAHAVVEDAIRASGTRWTFLRPGGFATNTLGWAPQIRGSDVLEGAYGDQAQPLIHEADIAAVAVRALTEDGHDGARHLLSGPAPISQADQVAAIGAALGRPLRWVEISPDEQRRRLAKVMPPGILDVYLSGLASSSPATGVVETITGEPGRTFAQWAADHVADFR